MRVLRQGSAPRSIHQCQARWCRACRRWFRCQGRQEWVAPCHLCLRAPVRHGQLRTLLLLLLPLLPLLLISLLWLFVVPLLLLLLISLLRLFVVPLLRLLEVPLLRLRLYLICCSLLESAL